MIQRINRGKNHSYKIDGQPAIGVTTALSKGIPKPALMYWVGRVISEHVADLDDASLAYLRSLGRDGMVRTLKQVPWAKRDAAAVQGTRVHALADELVRGREVDVPEELTSYVESTVKFMNDWRPRPLLTERTVASRRWGYAGTFDLIAELPNGKRVLFDYKTSASGIWPETALQLAAYRWADCYVAEDGTEIPMSEVGIDEAMAVWVRPDGYDVVPLATSEAVLKVFLHALSITRAVEAMPGWVGSPITPREYARA